MAQFDLKVWLQDKSREVITKAGKPVRIVCCDSPNKTFPIVGFVNNEEEIFAWDRFGYCREGHIEDENDLVFADAKENLSDDDRIRKGLIGHLKECRKNTRSEVMLGEYAKWIAWLENQKEKNNDNFPFFDEAQGTAFVRKQGEQNHTDKVEPKFKVGDWVRAISSGNIFKILSINDGLYRMLCYDGVEANYPIEDVDYDLVYWTIQDAKDGDILMANAPFIFNGNLEGGIGCPGAHCGINSLGKFQIPKYQEHWTGHTTTPATKEQRDLLFQKMKEAGYEWDAEKKELKKIEKQCEQKSANWSKKDEKMLNDILMCGEHNCHLDAGNIDWLKSLKDRYTWTSSDEDKKMLDFAIRAVGLCKQYAINHQVNGYSKLSDVPKRYEELQNWLKSLKPQSAWRPTDKQMTELERASWSQNFDRDVIEELYDDLKKL